MLKNKIGVIADGFRKSLDENLRLAAQTGADGVQLYAIGGEMQPDNLDRYKRLELKHQLESLGLEVSALCGDMGGRGFAVQEENPGKIEASKRIMDLALDLGCNIVTTHIGVVPHDTNDSMYRAMYDACNALGAYAEGVGAYFALETGAETAADLKVFLDALKTRHVAVNFDPGNMAMVTGDDPAAGFLLLQDYIVHTHVKDGVRNKPIDPRALYGTPGFEAMRHEKLREMIENGTFFAETPLGQGSVNFDIYFEAVEKSGYNGYLTVEREGGNNPFDDIKAAVDFIKKYRV